MAKIPKLRCPSCNRPLPASAYPVEWPVIREPTPNRQVSWDLQVPPSTVASHYRKLGHRVVADGAEYELFRNGKVTVQRYLTIHPLEEGAS